MNVYHSINFLKNNIMNLNEQWEELFEELDRKQNPEKYKLIDRKNKLSKISGIEEIKKNKFKEFISKIWNAL